MSATRILRPNEGQPFFKEKAIVERGPNGFPIGPRTKERQKQNRELGKLKIRSCEIHIPGICAGSNMLTWAHSKKSRFITSDKDWQEAARSCKPCHAAIESMSHADMSAIIKGAIARRRKP